MAAKMVSMKLSAKEATEASSPMSAGATPRYPYGLALNLDTEALDKLDIGKLPDVGESYMLKAKVDVTSVSSNKSEGGKSQSVTLQITSMCLEDADSGESADLGDALYPERGQRPAV